MLSNRSPEGVDGTLGPEALFPLPFGYFHLATGDISGDGATAIAITDVNSGLLILLQDPAERVPQKVVATANSRGAVDVTWSPYAGATSYAVYRRAPSGTFARVGSSATITFSDATVEPNTADLYRIRAAGPGSTTSDSRADLATTVAFTDDPIVPLTTTVKAAHLAELRRAVSAVRTLAGLPPVTFSADAVAGAFVRGPHVAELRTAPDPGLDSLSLAPGSYSEPIALGGVLKATHVQEIRARVK